MTHAGRALIETLEGQGVTAIFTVPGESFLAALDGMHDASAIRPIICRQEGGAAMMADAWGKVTGEPGICFVTRGPGIANAMSGLHVAQQDSTPMILFVGLPASDTEDRESFQEFDVKGLLTTFVKWSAVIRDASRIGEYVSRAFHVAMSGRPGPVVLGLPEDMLAGEIAAAPKLPPAMPARAMPDQGDVGRAIKTLVDAERPLIIVGGPGWSADACKNLQAFSEATGVPVATSLRAQDYFDNRHPNYVGCVGIGIDKTLADAVRDADVLMVIGARLGEMTTSGYTLVDSPVPKQRLIHVHPDPSELGTVYRAAHPIASDTAAFAEALAGAETPDARNATRARTEDLNQAYRATLKPIGTPGDVQPDRIIQMLSETLSDDAIVCNGAGNYAAFLHRYFGYKTYRSQLAPTSGSMGYGLPAGIAAKIAEPDKPVVVLAGDGCFMMTSQELATAMQYDLAMVIIVANNGMYGTIRMHQEREYPTRTVGTELRNPDFAAFAQAFGARGETVTRTEDFAEALKRAQTANGPALIELKIDPEAISPRQTLSQVRGD
ncbi:MAG: thiamine pyrophosphate-binding protein [Pseudomonadota bacterium]